jgi:small subunit ribosomal protein S9
MADDKAPDETTEGSDAQSAGPVPGEDVSSSQAAGDTPTPTPPAEEASEAPAEAAEAAPSAQDEAEEAPPAGEDSEEAAEEAPAEVAEPEASEEAEAAPEQPSEEAAPKAEGAEAAEKPEAKGEKKKDVIPGADLEPIAVEPEAPQLSAEERARLEAEEEEKARREAALTGEEPEPEAASRAPAKLDTGARFLATGKRKRSIARVTLVPGSGKFEVNKRSLEEFFPRPLHQTIARQPLTISGYEGSVDVRVRVHGGGVSGQAGAVRHGIARALTEVDPELRGDLKRRGFLTRDARVKERRKAGLKKARKRPQFSKR